LRIAVVSDTHRSISAIEKVCKRIKAEVPDLILHLGDVMDDADVMEAMLSREVRRVPGNCDYGVGLPHEILLDAEGMLIYAVHGHEQGVKRGLHHLLGEGARKGAKIILYGHTHVAREDFIQGIHLFNPGSAALPKEMQKPSMAFIEIRDQQVAFSIVNL
jgi:putative phosphoesterase